MTAFCNGEGAEMPGKRIRMKPLPDYVGMRRDIRGLVALVAKKERDFARQLIDATTNTKSSNPEQLAAYQRRLAHSIVELEAQEKAKSQKVKEARDPIRTFSIGAQEAVESYDPNLGTCAIRYFDSAEIHGGWFSGQRALGSSGALPLHSSMACPWGRRCTCISTGLSTKSAGKGCSRHSR